jgi:hypothetical protein
LGGISFLHKLILCAGVLMHRREDMIMIINIGRFLPERKQQENYIHIV